MRQARSNRQPTSFDRIADQYDATRGGEKRGREYADLLEPFLVPGPILEVGVGTGLVAAFLAERGQRVAGLDLSLPMVTRARDRIGCRVGLGDARALPVGDATVGNVLLVMVLHVVGDVEATFREAVRVLRPGGRVLAIYGMPVTDPPADGVPDDVGEALVRLDAVRGERTDEPAAVEAAATRAGLTTVHKGMTEPVRLAYSPASTISDIERRLWSFLWDVPEADWTRLVDPCLDALRALPDQQRQRSFSHRHRLAAFAR